MNRVEARMVAEEIERLKDKKPSTDERWLSPEELCKELSLNRNWLRRYGKLLPRMRFGSRMFRYPYRKVLQFLSSGAFAKAQRQTRR